MKLMLLYPRMSYGLFHEKKTKALLCGLEFEKIAGKVAASAECISLNCLVGCLTELNKN